MAILLTLAAALFTIVVGEIVPRSIALRRPHQTVADSGGAAPAVFHRPLRAAGLASRWACPILIVRPFGLTATFAVPMITEEELRTMLEASAQSGAIEEDERDIIRNVISFGDTEARQVMTPRIDIKALDVVAGLPALLDTYCGKRPLAHSRLRRQCGRYYRDCPCQGLTAGPGARRSANWTCARSCVCPSSSPENQRVDALSGRVPALRRAAGDCAG